MNKYKKQVKGVEVDVYDILHAYEVKSHSIGHAVKKLLMPGQRGSKGYEQDLKEAIQSIQRAIDDAVEPISGWFENNQNPCMPVESGVWVDAIGTDGIAVTARSEDICWSNTVKYRIINKESK